MLRNLKVGLAALMLLTGFVGGHSLRAGQIDYWAPGVICPGSGTIEMDVEFLAPRESMLADWVFLFRAAGNSPGKGTSTLSMVLCPPRDSRDLAAIVKSDAAYASVTTETPAFQPGDTARIALTWEPGEITFWWNGEELGRQPFRGEIADLPERFEFGGDAEAGSASGTFQVQSVRISDRARSADDLRSQAALTMDANTTLLKSGDEEEIELGWTDWQINHQAGMLFPSRQETPFLTKAGQPLTVEMRGVNLGNEARDYSVELVIRNRHGETVAERSSEISVPADSLYEAFPVAYPSLEASGYYESDLTVTAPNGQARTYRLNFYVEPRDAGVTGELADYLGHHNLVFADAGYQSVRSWAVDRKFLWFLVEPTPGRFVWGPADRFVEEAEAAGMDVLAVLGYPPAWASTYSPEERDRLNINPHGAYANSPDRYQPRSLEEWENYVEAVVSRYQGRVRYWEIYNEVDFHPPGMHATFSGTTEDYLELLESAYAIIKSIDPEAQVLTSGFSLLAGVNDTRMPLDLLKLGAADSFDIFALHGYMNREMSATMVEAVRETKPDALVWMTEYMFEKPADAQLLPEQVFEDLDQGFERYYLFGGELDRNFGNLAITPYYAVAAELSRQIRASDDLLGPVRGAGQEGYHTWCLRRADGSYLHIFSVRNGKLQLNFAPTETPVTYQATNVYGETLGEGTLPEDQPFMVDDWVYLIASEPLQLAEVTRIYENAVTNPGFEIREGDYLMAESAARPLAWELQPHGLPAGTMRFVPGRSGEFALKLKADAPANIRQTLVIDQAGTWEFSAWVRAEPGTKIFFRFGRQKTTGWTVEFDERRLGNGEWTEIKVVKTLDASSGQGCLDIGFNAPGGELEVDDVRIIAVEDGAADPDAAES